MNVEEGVEEEMELMTSSSKAPVKAPLLKVLSRLLHSFSINIFAVEGDISECCSFV